MEKKKPNHLIHETSPYLLQHAYNPVEWHAWGPEAFEKARRDDKPVLVSIGYAACHWCHVMEHESFENETTADFMNRHFINIKIDREERPDIDAIYMNACQLITGAGGWPLNMFLTPDLLPFTGGTYYPPKPGYGKPSWMEVLTFVHTVFTGERDKVEEQSHQLAEHIQKMDAAFVSHIEMPETGWAMIEKKELEQAVEMLKKQFDRTDGGFGNAPKFPGSMSLLFLLRMQFFQRDEHVMDFLQCSLQKMMFGGLFDQAEGGFARYCVDKKWMVPHFEKMLYDNALLISLYAEAFQFTGNAAWWKVVERTCAFLEKNMQHHEGGFYASYDADSEGVEGKYYTFSMQEIETATGENAALAKMLYNISETGNWEHTNILFRTKTDEELKKAFSLSDAGLFEKIDKINDDLTKLRASRIKPGLDDKIILSWNAMAVSAFVSAFKASGDGHYKEVAMNTLQFLLRQFSAGDAEEQMHHNYTKGNLQHPAFLEDYASLIKAMIDVYEISGDHEILERSLIMTTYVLHHFAGADGMFYFTGLGQTDIPIRNKDYYDNATPSGNSVMAENLLRLSVLSGKSELKVHAEKMLALIKKSALQYGTSFGNWLMVFMRMAYAEMEIAVCGNDANRWIADVLKKYYPITIIQQTDHEKNNYPLLHARFIPGKNLIYICRNGVCSLPVSSLQDFETAFAAF